MRTRILMAAWLTSAAFVACMSVDDRAGTSVPVEAARDAAPTDAQDAADQPATQADAAPALDATPGAVCPDTTVGGVAIPGCCRSTGLCGYMLAEYNGCVDPTHLGEPASTQTCTYTGTTSDGGDSDKDKDKDKDKDSDFSYDAALP